MVEGGGVSERDTVTEPGAPTSAPPALAAVTAACRDRLGHHRRRRRRPRRLRTPERASAPPHNRTAPRGASRHARARGRRAPAPPLPSLICRLCRVRACAPRRAGERGSERRVSSRPYGIQGKREAGGGSGRPTQVRAPAARAHKGERSRAAPTVPGQRPLPARGPRKGCTWSHALRPAPVALAAPPPSCHLRPALGHMRFGRWDAGFPGLCSPRGKLRPGNPTGSGSRSRLPVTVVARGLQFASAGGTAAPPALRAQTRGP